MGRRRKVTAEERASLGVAIVAVAGLLWHSDERRGAVLTVLAVLVPYLALLAPFECGGYRTAERRVCRDRGFGLFLGCSMHRFDRLGRLIDRDSDPARAANGETRLVPTAEPARTPAGAPVATRPRRLDLTMFCLAALATIAGWLAML